MPTNTLTDARVRAIKPDAAGKASKHFDGHGLYLWVSPTGAKVWRLAYRVDGKPRTMSLGPYPEISLADARTKRDQARAKLRDGVDPMHERRAPPAAAQTFTKACQEYWRGRKDLSPGYVANAQRALEMHLQPALGPRPMNQITRAELLAELARMDAAGLHVYVRKVRMWAAQVWDWAVEHGHAENNPAASIDSRKAFGRAQVESFAALELVDVGPFLQRLALEPDLQSVLACQLLAYTWARTGELRGMRWDEIDGTTWRIAAARMKRRRDHLVPLSRQAQQVLQVLQQRRLASEYVFPSEHRADRPMSENAVLYLIHRMGYKGRMTGHGWRSVGSTWANEHGYNADAIERQLAHAPDDKVRAVYNRAEYLPERVEMLQAWADWLESEGM